LGVFFYTLGTDENILWAEFIDSFSLFSCSMSVLTMCSNTDVKSKLLVTGVLTQHLRSALLNSSKEITPDHVRSVFDGLCRACSTPLPSTLLDSQPLEKGGLDIEGNSSVVSSSFFNDTFSLQVV
jgi:hypothetical protein